MFYVLCTFGLLTADANARPRQSTEDEAAPKQNSYLENPAVGVFIDDMVARNNFSKSDLERWFGRISRNATVVAAIAPSKNPETQRSWQRYRTRFLNEQRIKRGLTFWQQYDSALRKASQIYGVPEEIIVAIIGVETEYGRNMGQFRVMEALASLAFDYPPRADFFRGELEQLLLLARENKFDPLTIRGSFAGAIGVPQFMPGSLRRFAVDFDQDGRIDLRGSTVDAIGSVANFFVQHGWRSGEPVATLLNTPASGVPALFLDNILPKFELSQLAAAGIEPVDKLNFNGRAAVIDLVTPAQATEYWLGFENFYVISRYNRSSFYAMAVWQLSQAIRQRRF